MEFMIMRALRWIPFIIEYGVMFLGLGVWFFFNCMNYTNDVIARFKGLNNKSVIKSVVMFGVNAGLCFLVFINIYNTVKHFL